MWLTPSLVTVLLGSLVQAVVALALLGIAALGRGVRVRLLAFATAGAMILTLPALNGQFAQFVALPSWSSLVALGLFAVALVLGAWLCVERLWPRPRSDTGEESVGKLRKLLRREHAKLETVNQMHHYFELATRNSHITVFYQDKSLLYRWIVNPRISLTPDAVAHDTNDDFLPASVRSVVVGHKQRALTTNATQTFEVEVPSVEERRWYRVDVVPISEGRADPIGIVCTAIDITRSKRLDMMRTDLSRRLAETLQRFNLALRSERIMVFSQDLDLRYTWANADETQVGSIIGRTDEQVIPEADRAAIVELKRRVIESRQADAAEVGVGIGPERRWYDLNVEPNLRPDGSVAGITCASIDVTARKRNEEQMRLVLRELTHRTKNLLAVVIAITRQTANQSHSVDDFVPALVARLRALSAAQDLIVADDWAGVYISDLLRVLVGQYVPPQSARVTLEGPAVMLSPEASQNLGLAIHELAANAMRYGAFSTDRGTLTVRWTRFAEPGKGELLRIEWVERGGPPATHPSTRGFGMLVIERNLSRALGADVSMHFEPSGLTATITLPIEGVVPIPSPDRVELAKVG